MSSDPIKNGALRQALEMRESVTGPKYKNIGTLVASVAKTMVDGVL